MATSLANLDTTQYVKVNSKRESITLQSLNDTVRVVLSDVKPAKSNTVFHLLGGKDKPFQLSNIDTDVWVLSITSHTALVVTETEPVGRPSDYFIEIAKGNVPGSSLVSVTSKNREVGIVYEDITGFGGTRTFPAYGATEVLELVSDSADDATGGIGATVVFVESLDANHDTQFDIVPLNGVTPVAVAGVHTRVRSITAIAAGSAGTNVGNITLRVVGGDTRNYMMADEGASQDIHYTVPAGKTAYILQTYTLYAKDDSGEAVVRVRPEGASTAWISIAPIPVYQNMIAFDVKALLPLVTKTDLTVQAKSDTGTTANVNVILELLLVDD